MGVATMTRVEREAFLSETRYGMLSVAREGRGPIAVPIWHRWDAEHGELRFTSGLYSKKGQALAAADRARFHRPGPRPEQGQVRHGRGSGDLR